MKLTTCGLCFSLLLPASLVQADIYKCTGEGGHVTYSNVQSKGCQKLNLEPAQATSPNRSSSGPQRAAPPPSPSGTTSNKGDNAQRSRDDARKRILQDELSQETQALDQARKDLEAGEDTRLGGERNYQKYLDRIEKLKEEVVRHEQNVQSLEKELGGPK